MLDSIRNQKRLLFGILLLLILPSFVFFGVQGYDRMLSDEGVVAQVGERKIMQVEVDEAVRERVAQMQRAFGGQMDARMLDTPVMRRQVIDDLIAREALAQEARRLNLGATDARLRDEIARIPGLQKEGGGFDVERYKALLAAQNLDPARFEARMRADLAVTAPLQALGDSAFVPATVVSRVAALGEQQRVIRERRFSPADQAAKAAPTPEQLKKYYEDNGSRYETPETARIEVLQLDLESLAARITLPPDDVRAYYEQNKARFGTPEERRASHILIPFPEGARGEERKAARAKADGLLAQVKAKPAEFAAIAKAQSGDPGSAPQGGDLGFFGRDAMAKPFADAAFALPEGGISEVVESPFGFHVIQVTAIRASQVKPFEQVRADIEGDLRREQAQRRYAEAAETFSNLVEDRSDSLKPAAEKLGLTSRVVESYGRTGSGATGADGKPLAIDSPRLVSAVFTDEVLKNGRNTPAVEVAPGTLVSARVLQHRPAVRKPFETVEAEVRAAVQADNARRLAVQAGEAALAAARQGTAPEGLGAARAVSRIAPAGLTTAARDAVFRAGTTKLPAWVGVDLGAEGYALYTIEAVKDGADDAAARQRRVEAAQKLASLTGQAEAAAYVEYVKQRVGVKAVKLPSATPEMPAQ